jgi:FtsH-binding integral membrane protein
MTFILRRPFAVSSALKQVSQPSQIIIRGFHNSPLKKASGISFAFNSSKPIAPVSILNKPSRNVFQQTFRRSYSGQSEARTTTNGAELRKRLLYGAIIFGGTMGAINLVFNRETREDGGMPPFERKYLNDTFLHTGLGVGIIGLAARTLHTNGWSLRLMSTNPWLVFGVGLAGSIGTMMATQATPPENYVQKYAFWGAFNLTQAMLLSPLMFIQPAILAKAGLYTVGMMGSIAFVGATAKQEKYLYLGGPLLAGVAIVALSGITPLVLPVTAARTLMVTENLWLYGGLAVFGGFTLYDVQKVLHHARLAQQGLIKPDPVNEAIALELDFLNIFIRMVQILGMQGRRK